MKALLYRWTFGAVLSTLIFIGPAFANLGQIRLPAILSDGAVLQAELPVPVWGDATPLSEVRVKFGDQQATSTADASGRFQVQLQPMPIESDSRSLIISDSAGARRVVEDVIVGEVWLASGQSNMEWELEHAGPEGQRAAMTSDDPLMRMFLVERRARLMEGGDVVGRWVHVRPRSARRFSAVGFFFGQNLRNRLNAPVGVIAAAWGGTQVQAWSPEEALEQESAFAEERLELEASRERNRVDRNAALESFEIWLAQAQAQADPMGLTSPPGWPDEDFSKNTPSVLFNGMIEPLIPYSLRGVIWYQGESDHREADLYAPRLRATFAAWRARWGQDLPFGQVQLAPYDRYDFTELRQAQSDISTDPGIGIVSTEDLGNPIDIHPRRKAPVGDRLADWAIADVYCEDC